VTMAPKAKNVAGLKRSRKGEAFGFKNREPIQKFGKKGVEHYGWESFECQCEPKHMGDEYVHEVKLQSQFPDIYRTVLDLGLRFIFNHSGDCNLSLIREFYLNWLTETKYKIVSIRGTDVKFNATILNEFLETPNCDSDAFNKLKDKPLYRDIRHTLCGVAVLLWGLITRFLRARGIEKEVVDLTIAFHPNLTSKLVDVTRTKALDTSHGSVLSAQGRQVVMIVSWLGCLG
ncbi:hypothetical protein H5410_062721, partial [Solanum commersonii]